MVAITSIKYGKNPSKLCALHDGSWIDGEAGTLDTIYPVISLPGHKDIKAIHDSSA